MSAMDLNEYDSTDIRGFYSWTNTLAGVHYGPGITESALPKLLDAIGGKRALIVTGKSLLEKSDVVTKVINILNTRNAHAGTLSSIGQHAPIAGIREGVKLFQSSGADCIVSVGGGSPIDASKAIIHQLHQEDTSKPFFRQIAIPTTLSAAEYTVGAGFTNDKGKKETISDPHLAPSGVILDAELTLATPERLWLSTGMRAVDHAVENLYRPLVPPPIKHLCYASIRDLFTYLPKSKAAPMDLKIRQKLQLAAWMSLWPLKLEKYSALGLSHALGHKLGAAYSIPHGITSCLTLAPVVRYKAQATPPETKDDDREWLAGALGVLGVPSQGNAQADGLKLADLIQKLIDDLGLTSTLTEYKVPKEDVPQIAELALGKKDTPAFEPVVRMLEAMY